MITRISFHSVAWHDS